MVILSQNAEKVNLFLNSTPLLTAVKKTSKGKKKYVGVCLNSTPCEPKRAAFGALRYVARRRNARGSNLRRLAGKRAFRLGFARLSAPRLLRKLRHKTFCQHKKAPIWVPCVA